MRQFEKDFKIICNDPTTTPEEFEMAVELYHKLKEELYGKQPIISRGIRASNVVNSKRGTNTPYND